LIVSEKEMRRVKMTGLHWHMTHTKFHKNPSISVYNIDVCTKTCTAHNSILKK